MNACVQDDTFAAVPDSGVTLAPPTDSEPLEPATTVAMESGAIKVVCEFVLLLSVIVTVIF